MKNLITPEMAQAELDRRDAARQELGRRGLNDQPSNHQGAIDSIANSAPVNMVLGAGDALRNNLGGALSLIPGVNIGPVKSSEGAAYNIGKVGGEIGSFYGGGELLNALRGATAAKNIPAVSKIAGSLGGEGISKAIRRTLGAGIGGFLTNPEDRKEGAEIGAALGLASHAIPEGFKVLGKSALNPLNYRAKVIAKNIASDKKAIQDEYSQRYKDLFNEAEKAGVKTVAKPPMDISKIREDVPDTFISRLEEFLNNPTPENAHFAQSDLGRFARKQAPKAAAGNLTSDQNKIYKAVLKAQKGLKESMTRSFNRRPELDLHNKYEELSNGYRKEVIPYRESKALNKYLNKKIGPKQMIHNLSGEYPFMSTLGKKYPIQINQLIRKLLLPAAIGTGTIYEGYNLLNKGK